MQIKSPFKNAGIVGIIIVINFSYPQGQHYFEVTNFDEISNVELQFFNDDGEQKYFVGIFQDFTFDTRKIQKQITVELDTTFSKKRRRPQNLRYFLKRVKESVHFGEYVLSLLSFRYLNEQMVENSSGLTDDIFLWKKHAEKYQLVQVYPNIVGGCFYCSTNIYNVTEDSLIIEARGGDAGDEIINRYVFFINNNNLWLKQIDFISGGYDNPVKSANSWVIKTNYLDEFGNGIKKRISFKAEFKNRGSVALAPIVDSLMLYEAAMDFPYYIRNKYVKTVKAGIKPIPVGPIRSNWIPVFYEDTWFITKYEYFIEKHKN
jgi:hypothetical protein